MKNIILMPVAVLLMLTIIVNAHSTTMTLDRKEAASGESVSVSGTGRPNDLISIKVIDKELNILYFHAASSDGSGIYDITITIPDVAPGILTVTAGNGNNVKSSALEIYGICGPGIADTDLDGDGTVDCNDAFPQDPNESADNDGDGTGDIADRDDDNDGMPDDWEIHNGLDGKVADAHGDEDSDGLSNLGEYQKGSDPNHPTMGPGIPVLISPTDMAQDVSLTPMLEIDYAETADTSTHVQTRWQVATDMEFSVVALDIESEDFLNMLALPTLILSKDIDYYWRARYIDSDGVAWMWSADHSFSTAAMPFVDDDNDNIPDDQQVAEGIEQDLDGDGTPDTQQANMIAIALPDGIGQISFKAEENVQAIEGLMRIDPADINDSVNRPDALPMGLYGFRCVLKTPGLPASVRIFCSTPFADDATWHKYDAINGWQDYGPYVTFNADRNSLLIEFTDGGNGDADGTVNGVIVDPSGPSTVFNKTTANGSGGSGGCFIYTLLP